MEIRWGDIIRIIQETFGPIMTQNEIARRLKTDKSNISRMKNGTQEGPKRSQFDLIYDNIFRPKVAKDGTLKYWKTYPVLYTKLLDAIEKCGYKEKLSSLWDEDLYPHTENGYKDAVMALLSQMNSNVTPVQSKSRLKQKKERLAEMTEKIFFEDVIEQKYDLRNKTVYGVSDYAKYCVNFTIGAIFRTVIYNFTILNNDFQIGVPENRIEQERLVALIIKAFDGIIDWNCSEMTPLLSECISLPESTSLDEKRSALFVQAYRHINEQFVDSIMNSPSGDDPIAKYFSIFAPFEDRALQLTVETYDSAADSNSQK